MEKNKYYFAYRDKIFWIWLTKSQRESLNINHKDDLSDEEFERIKQYIK